MAKQFCQACGASLMQTLRMCPTCGSKNLGINPPQTSTNLQNNNSVSVSSPVTSNNNLNGLGGWLLLVGFGLIIGFLKLINSVHTLFKPYINTDLLNSLTNVNLTTYIPNFLMLFYMEVLVNAFMVLMSAYLIYLYFTKSKKFPKYYIFITLFVLLAIPMDAYIASTIIPTAEVIDKDMVKSVFQSLFLGAIWIPYMLKSLRVRNTFIED